MSHRKKHNRKWEKKHWQREGVFNRHHIFNKCRGGHKNPENLLTMDIARHNAWHFLFGNDDFLQVAHLLIRTYNLKNHITTTS